MTPSRPPNGKSDKAAFTDDRLQPDNLTEKHALLGHRTVLRVQTHSERHVEPVDEEEPVYEYVAERREYRGKPGARSHDGRGEAGRRGINQAGGARLGKHMACGFYAQAAEMRGASPLAGHRIGSPYILFPRQPPTPGGNSEQRESWRIA